MNNVPGERILVERLFDVEVPAATVWALLARQIRRARLVGGGPLGPDSKGELRFRPAGSGSVQMTIWEPPRLWTWRGRVVVLPIVYHHHFEALSDATTELRWVVELAEGRRGLRADAFARIYARIVDRAWPRFVAWTREEAARRGST